MMMNDNKRKIASIIIGGIPSSSKQKPMQQQQPQSEQRSEETLQAQAEKDLAQKLISAISEKDPVRVVKYFKELMVCCEMEPGEEEWEKAGYGKSDEFVEEKE